MSFNPYEVRPIGSDKFEEHLQDIYVSEYYRNQLPADDEDPLKLAAYGTKIWRSEPAYDPWIELIFAVTAQAVVDYIEAYKHWKRAQEKDDIGAEVMWHSRMLQMENEYFRSYEITEILFDKLLKMLETQYAKTGADRIMERIIHNYFTWCTKNDYQKGMIRK